MKTKKLNIPMVAYVKLTKKQIEQLKDLFDYAEQQSEEGLRGMIFGQPLESDGKISFGFIEHDYAESICAITERAAKGGKVSRRGK